MSEELQEILKRMKDFAYYGWLTKKEIYILSNYIEQLQQENKNLKEKINISETNYDIIYGYFSKVNELLETELCEDAINKILHLQKENKELKIANKLHCKKYKKFVKDNHELVCKLNILTEFEKWLEEQIIEASKLNCVFTDDEVKDIVLANMELELKKLQELKEGKK